MSLTPGQKIGPYEIVSLLGVGGMGEVYRARDPRLRRDVAIKSPSHSSFFRSRADGAVRPRTLTEQRYEFGVNLTFPNYSLSHDGRQFLMVKGDNDNHHFSLVFNWLK